LIALPVEGLFAEERTVSTLLECDTIDAETSTTELVHAAQAGNRQALGELAERYEHVVYATGLRRLGNHVEAQELVQEVFVQVLRKIGQLREPEAIVGWLRSITNRMAINRRMRSDPEVLAEPATLELECLDHQTPLRAALASERKQQVEAGLNRLRALDRDTLMAFYIEGQSLAQMSTSFDSPVGTIKRRLHVARKRLAQELEELAPA
jgi:RNA polymerase sigma-70 factor (ECF subfamily)